MGRAPVDLTALAAVLLLPSLALMALARAWWVHPRLGLPLLATTLLALWLTLAGGWSASALVLAEKLPQAAVAGPIMLILGLLVGGDPTTLRRCAGATVAIGVLVGAGVAWGVSTGQVVLGGEPGADPTRVRVAYQIAGLAIATAGGVAAVFAVEARGAFGFLFWVLVVVALGGLVLVPGGRLALLGLGIAVAAAPALRLALAGRAWAAVGWAAAAAAGAVLGLLGLLLAVPDAAAALATLERVLGGPTTATPARLLLWGDALRWAGAAHPFGLGTGGFTLASGTGDDRSLHPHNHALEAFAEGGWPGLLLWLACFGGGIAFAVSQAARVAPGRAARIAALTIPLALTAMVSTDLGNRMVWFGLGLLLSLGVEARVRDG